MIDRLKKYIYIGKARPDWHGRKCVIGARFNKPRNVLIKFLDDDSEVVTHSRCLEKVE